MLEQYVLAKPYFDPPGLLLAIDKDEIVGMIHAGFGASEDRSTLDHEMGVICMLLLAPHVEDGEAIGSTLIALAQDYLQQQGAKVLYAGGIHPMNPFYLGLYGGSELPGILAGDTVALHLLQQNGYEVVDQVAILERDLSDFRPKVDRKTLQVRRKYHIEATFDPPLRSWWDACSYGITDRTQFVLRGRGEETPACSATFWDLEPLASSWGVQAVGLIDLATSESLRREGLATYLVGEALRQLHAYGISRCQVQTMQSNEAALGLYSRLGFEQVDQGLVLRRVGTGE